MPLDLDERFRAEAASRGASFQGSMREAALVWILLGKAEVERVLREASK